jgi:hypothetical protein
MGGAATIGGGGTWDEGAAGWLGGPERPASGPPGRPPSDEGPHWSGGTVEPGARLGSGGPWCGGATGEPYVVPEAEPAADGGGEDGGPPGEDGTDALPETRAVPVAGGVEG